MGEPQTQRLVIPSRLDQIVPTQDTIVEDVERGGYSQQALFAIRLALDEALVNAVKHGNKLDPDKTVTVEYSVTPDAVTITVEDQGEGFKPADLADPTDEQHLARPNGRGVMLINAYMTEVSYNDKGNRVTLVKTRACQRPHAG